MKKRVLHVYPQLNCGGTEMVIYNLIKFGDHESHFYELLVQRQGDNEEIFRKLGVPIHSIEYTSAEDYQSQLAKYFRKERFDVVHAHMHGELPQVLKAAEEASVKCRVAHSHNARVDIPVLLWPLFYFRHHPYEKYATQLFGCSRLALRWLFPGRWRRGHVIYNGIDLDSFRFDPEARRTLREQYSIGTETKVFINVGRCTDQKNQKFILELAAERRDRDELFVIIGTGPLYRSLVEYKEAHSLDNLLLLGKRDDVASWLSVADVFLFPSVYEGLGIVAIEAEASGLQVLASDTIPAEADMRMGNFRRIPLKDKAKWHALMSEPVNTAEQRRTLSEKAKSSVYNIHNVVKTAESIYSESC